MNVTTWVHRTIAYQGLADTEAIAHKNRRLGIDRAVVHPFFEQAYRYIQQLKKGKHHGEAKNMAAH